MSLKRCFRLGTSRCRSRYSECDLASMTRIICWAPLALSAACGHRELDALERIQARKKLWQQFQEWASSDMQRRQMQDPQTMRYLSLGARIDDIQQHLE